jgi:ribose/xylose/arabinose/galactoside ABC-type transport system permease subunit
MTGITDRLSRTAESLKGIGTGELATAGGPQGAAKEDGPRRDWRTVAADYAERWGVLIVFAVMIIVFSLLSPDVFPTWRNTLSILEQASVVVLLAVGLTYVLAAGEFDLSFPYVYSLASGVCVISMTKWGLGAVPAIFVGLGVGAACGLINGIFVATKRASSFIITLALGTAYTGLMYGIAGEAPITAGISKSFINLTTFEISEITLVVIVMFVVAITAGLALRSSVFGRHVKATGSNPNAAAVAGVKVSRVRIGCYVVLGLTVATAAVLQTSLSAAFYPTGGTGLFLPPFVAAFIGTSVLGRGQFTVFGTVVGALFIGTLQTGLLMQNIPSWVIYVVQGGVLLAAVMAAAQTRSRHR